MDNALDQHPGLIIVAGGNVNRLDTNEVIVMTGWDSLVDYPTRGDAYLDKVFTNRPDFCKEHSILCVHKNRSHRGHFTSRNEIKANQTKRSH